MGTSFNSVRVAEPTAPADRRRPPRTASRGMSILLALGSLIVIVLLAMLAYQWIHADRVYPGVTVFGVQIGGANRAEAKAALLEHFEQYGDQLVEFRFADRQWQTTLREIGTGLDAAKTLDKAFSVGRVGNPIERLRAQLNALFGTTISIKPALTIDEAKRTAFFVRLARQIDQPMRDASLTIDQASPAVVLNPSQPGLRLDLEKTAQVLEEAIVNQSHSSIELVVQRTEPTVVEADLEVAQTQAQDMLASSLTLEFQGRSWSIEPKQIAQWIVFQKDKGETSKVSAKLADEPLNAYLADIAKKIDQQPMNARFNYDRSQNRLSVLRQSVDGLKMDVAAAAELIKGQILTDKRTVTLPVAVMSPAIKSEDIDKLVIRDLIEEASTSYAGSVPERAHNVELASSRLNGVVVAPGQVFSLNKELGPVTLASGFQVGWGITMSGDDMVTVPSEGGGICQVATTLFHPLFWAGYPIVERVGHLYWIPKYGTPPKGMKGLDATVDTTYDKDGNLIYEVDFKFENNTDNPILIQSKTDGNTVTFSLYGVKPDWQVKVDGPLIEDVVKANTEIVRQEDPTLPVGQQIMVEEARDGFKATVVRTVTKDGEVLSTQEFISRYRPSRNVYVVGTKQPASEQTSSMKPD